MIPADLSFEDIAVGMSTSFSRTISTEDVESFAKLSGDYNPLHIDDAYAKTTKFGKRVVHGMLLGALCSQLVGMHLPGKRCLYLQQTLSFKKPVFVGDMVSVQGVVEAKSPATKVLDIAISIMRDTEEVASGLAKVQVLP